MGRSSATGSASRAKFEFIRKMRAAQNFLNHQFEYRQDSIDADRSIHDRAKSAVWFTPAIVQGFNVKDCAELGPESCERLKGAVDEFRKVVSRTESGQPPSVDQVENGRKALEKILLIIAAAYLGEPRESFMVR